MIGSGKTSTMGEKEAVPFSSREAATAFVAQFGGQIADYDSARTALAVEPAPDGG